jgi:hypothetical protein
MEQYSQVDTSPSMSEYFEQFRENIIGQKATFRTPFGEQPLIYAD